MAACVLKHELDSIVSRQERQIYPIRTRQSQMGVICHVIAFGYQLKALQRKFSMEMISESPGAGLVSNSQSHILAKLIECQCGLRLNCRRHLYFHDGRIRTAPDRIFEVLTQDYRGLVAVLARISPSILIGYAGTRILEHDTVGEFFLHNIQHDTPGDLPGRIGASYCYLAGLVRVHGHYDIVIAVLFPVRPRHCSQRCVTCGPLHRMVCRRIPSGYNTQPEGLLSLDIHFPWQCASLRRAVNAKILRNSNFHPLNGENVIESQALHHCGDGHPRGAVFRPLGNGQGAESNFQEIRDFGSDSAYLRIVHLYGHVAYFPGGHIHQTPHFRVFIIVGEQIEIQRTNGPCRGLASVNIGIEHIGSLSQGSNLNRLRLKTFPAYSDLSHSGFHPVNRPKPGLTVLYCDSGNVLVLHRPVQGCRIGIRRFYGQGNLPFGGIGVDFRRHRE